MSSLLFIGTMETSDGWGEAARHYVRALRTTGLDIKVKNLYTTPDNKYWPEFDDLRSAKIDKFDYVIQNCMPSQFCYDKEFGKNIGLFYVETCGWNNNWAQNCRMMDDLWVSCNYSKKCVRHSLDKRKLGDLYVHTGQNVSIKSLPIPYDVERTKQEFSRLPETITQGKFMFYFVGEDITRKNIDMLIKAFYLEFDRQENVGLLIKTNRVGGDPKIVYQMLQNRIEKIKKDLNLYNGRDLYQNIAIITDRVPEKELFAIHNSCDCFVMPSSGEGWSIPALDAKSLGKWVIMTNSGCVEYAADLIIDSEIENIYSEYHPTKDLVTGYEEWMPPKLSSLKNCMRTIFNKHLSGQKPYPRNLDGLSYKAIGEKICQML